MGHVPVFRGRLKAALAAERAEARRYAALPKVVVMGLVRPTRTTRFRRGDVTSVEVEPLDRPRVPTLFTEELTVEDAMAWLRSEYDTILGVAPLPCPIWIEDPKRPAHRQAKP
jgi:hypothetical protein